MDPRFFSPGVWRFLRTLSLVVLLPFVGSVFPQVALGDEPNANPRTTGAIYQQLKAFQLTYGSVSVRNLVLQRDRATITFTDGTFYFPMPVQGQVRGAVFVGTGTFRAEIPPGEFERDNVRRLLNADEVASDFKSAVLQFTDDTFQRIGNGAQPGATAPAEVVKLAQQLGPSFLEETGANLAARELISILNHEAPGLFFAQFSGGHRGRFSFLMDYQARIPVANFEINAGEKGLVFAFDHDMRFNTVWMAFPALEEYQQGKVTYADVNNLVTTPHYWMDLDLREPKKWLTLTARMEMHSRADHLLAIPLALNEDLSAFDDERRKKQLKVKAARLAGGGPLEWYQEPWEGGLTVILPAPLSRGQKITLELEISGEFMFHPDAFEEMHFPLRTTTWFPRHGDLQRSVFDVSIRHRKDQHVASIGSLVHEDPVPDTKGELITEFRIDEPVALTTFSVGPYEIHKDTAKLQDGRILPIEFYSLPGSLAAIKEDFILAELSNCVRYFSSLFGEYPYPVFRGVFHPFGFGQGFATTLMIPGTDRASKFTYVFIAHETAHQWWGDVVLWRSYRDQWLSEGFAEYSGLLYTQLRDKTSGEKELIERARDSLKNPPRTLTGIGKGRLADVGPLVMGHRLSTRETGGAYQSLIYNKGALVLRMLHFLFTDQQTGNGQPFFDMMADFVKKNAGRAASTDDFFAVANAHVEATSFARKYGYKDLNWFYRQWVLQAYFPSYRLDYHIEDQPGGGAVIRGTVIQEGLPESEKWFMPLPLAIHFGGGKEARATIAALGKETPVNIRLPMRPEKVELDPALWVLSDKTSVNKLGH